MHALSGTINGRVPRPKNRPRPLAVILLAINKKSTRTPFNPKGLICLAGSPTDNYLPAVEKEAEGREKGVREAQRGNPFPRAQRGIKRSGLPTPARHY